MRAKAYESEHLYFENVENKYFQALGFHFAAKRPRALIAYIVITSTCLSWGRKRRLGKFLM
jgi:hypothetical protein